MLDIFNKKALEAAKAQLANTQAKLDSQAKKTKTAAIIGGSTTAAAAVVAGITFFTGGRKINREKIKNYELVVEERNKALHDAAESAAKAEHATNMAVTADGCCFRMSAAFDSGDESVINEVKQNHLKIHETIFGETSQNTVNAAVAVYDEFIKSLNAQNQQQPQNPVPQQKNDPAPQQKNDPAPQQKNDPAPTTPAAPTEALKAAQAKRNAACKKAGDAKTALENAQKNLNAAKTTDSTGDHSALEKAVAEAKAAFDAANKELVDADAALKDIQANQQK